MQHQHIFLRQYVYQVDMLTRWICLLGMYISWLVHFLVNTFPSWYFSRLVPFPVGTFPSVYISRCHISQLAHFPVGTFPGWYFSQCVHFLVGTFPGWHISRLAHFPVGTFPGWYFSHCVHFPVDTFHGWHISRLVHSPVGILDLPDVHHFNTLGPPVSIAPQFSGPLISIIPHASAHSSPLYQIYCYSLSLI